MATKNHKKKSPKHHAHSKSHGSVHKADETEHAELEIEASADDHQGQEPHQERVVEEVSQGFSEAESSHSHAGSENSNHHAGTQDENPEVKLEFPCSELARAYAPKAMEVADKVATDWKNDGSFMNLGIENPYANRAVALGLKKAKDLEKKLDEKGVLSVVRMGVEVLKQQVNRRK